MALYGFKEGHSIICPPFFNGTDYTYWKTRMRVFLLSLDLNLWDIVENGFEMSSLPMNHWNDLKKKMFSLNSKAMNDLYCALDKK